MQSIPKAISNSIEIEANRKESRMIQDKIETDENDAETYVDEIDESNESVKNLEKSSRIIDVLGLIIKTKCGSLPKRKTTELIEEVETLNLRLLNLLLTALKDTELMEWITERIETIAKEKNRILSPQEMDKMIKQNIQLMGLFVIIGTLQRTYEAIATKQIVPLQKDISEKRNTVAFDLIFIFISMRFEGLNIKTIEKYYKKYNSMHNFWATSVLQMIVIEHLTYHDVDYKIRQQIANLIEIAYIPNNPSKQE